ncbi:MAG: SMC family ATPase [Anaerolineaceae bacterium]|nr:SMC family ATPase [Anaerolineaceae bacterium]
MIPVKLSISGFLSYKEPAELDFSDFQIACVSGSNGAGKSTIFDAITWALFGIARSRDDSIINHASDQAEVVFDFQYENQDYRIQRIKTRDKTALLEFYIKKEDQDYAILTEHALRETQKRIESTLKLDYETFINAAFFLQGKADLFTQQTPGDRKRILSTILGLDQWEVYRANAAEMRRSIEMEIGSLSGRVENIKAELADEDNRIAQLKEYQQEKEEISKQRQEKETTFEQARTLADSIKSQQEMQTLLTTQQENTNKKIEQLINRIETRKNEIEHFQQILHSQTQIEDGYSQSKQAAQHLSNEQKKATVYHALLGEIKAAQLEIENTQKQLSDEAEQLRNRASEIKDIEEQISKQEKELATIQQEITDLSAEIASQEVFETESADKQENIQQVIAKNNHLKQLMQELKEKIDLINHQENDQCPLCTQPLDEEHRQQILNAYADEGKQFGDSFRNNQEVLKKLNAEEQVLENKLAEIKKLVNSLQTKQRTKDQLQFQIDESGKSIEKWQTDQAPHLETVQTVLSNQDFAQEARNTQTNKKAELEKLAYEPEALVQLEDIVNELKPYEDQYNELQKALSAIEPLQREINENQTEVEQTQKELTDIEHNLGELSKNLENVSSQIPDIDLLQNELNEIRAAENRVQMAVGGAMQKVEVLASLKTQQKALDKEISQQNKQISALKRLEQAFSKDGVPALLIEQALPDIEEEANKILERLSDGMMSVQFNTQSAYKDKKRTDKKETLDILISDSAGPRPYEMYSGGEAFRVNFAIRLALSKVLARRAGARLQTLVIDEGFGSQDAIGRQRLVEVINLIRSDFEKILIITHLEELKDSFSARIEVEKSDKGSMIEVIANI